MSGKEKSSGGPETRRELLRAATELMCEHGFSATTVDGICAEAGVTKGAFFHYFKSKEDLGQSAVAEWRRCGTEMYEGFLGDPGEDPLIRLRRLFDGMIGLAQRPNDPPVCLVGMMAQELAATLPAIRETCSGGLDEWTGMVVELLEEARRIHRPRVEFDSRQIGWMLNSLWQGSMLVAKTRRDASVIVNNLRHARAYIDGLFSRPEAPAFAE